MMIFIMIVVVRNTIYTRKTEVNFRSVQTHRNYQYDFTLYN